MLYLWPYITFFSLPLQLPYLLNFLPRQYLPTLLLRFRQRPVRSFAATFYVVCILCGLALTAIHLNTIVHPFTLADNRHYVFYVFRILVLKNVLYKYLAAPIYILCAWAAFLALAGPEKKAVKEDSASASKSATVGLHKLVSQNTTIQCPNTVSFLLIYLLTCTLCLVTAPLVEPRYFILPWITWRLYVPSPPLAASAPPTKAASDAQEHDIKKKAYRWDDLYDYDYRLLLETFWFLTINAATGYMFLYRGFSWPQEPGKVQRFMW